MRLKKQSLNESYDCANTEIFWQSPTVLTNQRFTVSLKKSNRPEITAIKTSASDCKSLSANSSVPKNSMHLSRK